jgi:hypothetical protein
MNNYNFGIVFSFAYAISMLNPLINPSLVILIEIIPGFITQILYPRYLYQTTYIFRFSTLFVTQIISSLFLIFFTNHLVFVFSSIALVSINSYLGESTMLSLSSFYQKSDLSLWSMGTGMAGLLATGMFLLFNMFLSQKIIFVINLLLYLLIYGGSLFLLNLDRYIDRNIEKNKELREINQDENNNVEQGREQGQQEQQEKQGQQAKNQVPQQHKDGINSKHFTFQDQLMFFKNIYTICLAYLITYLFGFAYVPLMVKNNQEYQISQFLTRTFMFFGRITGNYIPLSFLKYLWIGHLYNLFCLVLYTTFLIKKIEIPFLVFEILLVITYFINGINYPMIYHYVYENYQNDKEKHMGSVGQFTAFFTALGCLIGYPLQIILV